ncbi:MAG: rhomboid family intramembrane serine protease [Flavitalea sp.]
MFIPIGDDNKDRHRTPYVNYILIIINVLVFIFLEDYATNEAFIYSYSTVPAEILQGQDLYGPQAIQNPITRDIEYIQLGVTEIPVYLTLISSMFMHGGWAHLLGNMMYLWIFGDNLENIMGHKKYLLFYFLCGVIAALAHVFSTAFFDKNLMIPSLGASGAISGILGGYILLFPTKSVHVWVFFLILSVPAFIAVGVWFVFQLINGMGILGGEEAGGIAYAAHIGGFIAGLVLVKLFIDRKQVLPQKRKSVW